MKNRIAFLISILVLFTGKVLAQTAVIPDAAFLSFLKSSYPQTINVSDKLILTEAEKVTGTMTCHQCGISSIQGIQYFKGIQAIYFAGNTISTLPDISALTNLEILNLAENSLTTLPSLNGLAKLKKLLVYDNNLSSIPHLANHPLLTDLIVYNNQLSSLPDMSSLTGLLKLEIGGNRISSLPDLSNSTQLHSLLIWGNRLTELPDLSVLTNLTLLNAGRNRLTSVPDLSNNMMLQELILDNNFLAEVPELTSLNNLQHVVLENNALTFEDLIKYSYIPDYQTIFSIFPQTTIITNQSFSIQEGTTDTLTTGIDQNVPGVKYSWNKNTMVVSTVEEDAFIINSATETNAGDYYVKLSHPAFPGGYLTTEAINVTVVECISLSSLSFEKKEINCLASGSLIIKNNSPFKFNYLLKSPVTGLIDSSLTGKFIGLTQPSYNLVIITESGCKKSFPQPIDIPFKECPEAFITPNSDGDNDAIFFQYEGKAVIYDTQGNIVKTLSIPAEWDGSSLSGIVPPGYYVAELNDGEDFVRISVIY